MAIDRTVFNTWVDDSGSGTDGTIWNKAAIDAGILDPIDAMGVWIAPSFSAGNFTGGASQTWTVASGDVTTYAYALLGTGVMTVAFDIRTSSVGGTPDPVLKIAIPASKTATRTVTALIVISDNGGTRQAGMCQVVASGTVINIYKDVTTATNWTAATDTTSVQGVITFEVS